GPLRFFFSSRRRHTRFSRDWSSDVCSSDLDTSTSAECERIMEAVGGARRCIAIAGNPILAGYTASKLPWTRTHRPQAYAELATVLLPHDYVDYWLTGECWMEHGDASGTGWLDVRRREWSQEMLAATDPDR